MLHFSAEAIKWTYSYITGRSQAVMRGDKAMAEFLPVTSGVPQGSAPGPILFLILVNSLPTVLKYSKFLYALFADDLQLFVQCPVGLMDEAVSRMTEDALEVSRWAEAQGLRLNANKMKAIIFGSRQNLSFVESAENAKSAKLNLLRCLICYLLNLLVCLIC